MLYEEVLFCLPNELKAHGAVMPSVDVDAMAESLAETNQRELAFDDLIWAQRRLETIKKYLVPNCLPPGWQAAITEFACRAAENCANKAATRDLQEAKSLARLYEQQAFVWAADDGLPSLVQAW